MNRATLTLLASAGGLTVMLLMSNPADAAPVVAQATDLVMSAPAGQVINLHDNSSMLNLAKQQRNPILDQLGCGCAACTKALNQMQGKLTVNS